MKQNNVVYLTIIGLIVVFIISGAIVVKNRHNNRMILVVEKEILEAANKCSLDQVCDEEITLQILYDKDYLTEQYNPITKKKYDSNLTIDIGSNDINWINS